MDLVAFAIGLFGAAFLLLFAVGQVRQGVERCFGPALTRALETRTSRPGAVAVGLILAIAMQSATAVGLLVTGFHSTTSLTFSVGLAILLGADLGSAIVVGVLSLDLTLLQPLLLFFGGWFFLKGKTQRARSRGQIVLGLALILVSLDLMAGAVSPLRDSPILAAGAAYIQQDALTGLVIGAALAVALHSSVAAILMCVALVSGGGLEFGAALPVVLGANLGGGLVALWLTRDLPVGSRRLPFSNALLRGLAALVAVVPLYVVDAAVLAGTMPDAFALIASHVVFNLAVLLLGLALSPVLGNLSRRLMPEPAEASLRAALDGPLIALDHADPDADPSQTISAVRQDILRMLEEVERMIRPILVLYDVYSPEAAETIRRRDRNVNAIFSNLWRQAAHLELDKSPRKELRSLLDYAVRVEAAGDLVAKKLTQLASEYDATGSRFSDEGVQELRSLHGLVQSGFGLARHVLLVDDLEAARRLVLDKAEVKRAERNSRKAHMKRIERANGESLATSDVHLETLRALRELFGHVAAVAYPILYRNGQILETRLIPETHD